MSIQSILWCGLWLALAMEALTIWLRFGRGVKARKAVGKWIGPVTRGWRIHHGYVGAVCIAFGWPGLWPFTGEVASWAIPASLMILGIGLLVSDLVHHFLVLWPVTGTHEFELRYPDDAWRRRR